MATTISKLSVALTARTDGFNKNMKKSQSRLERFRSATKLAAGRLKVFSAIAAAVGVAAIAKLTKTSLANIDATTKFADRIGIATDKLVGLQHAAKLNGTSTENLNLGLQRMTRRVAEAAQGMGEAQSALEALNLDAAALASLSPDEQFLKIADSLNKVEDQGERVRLAFKLFDSEGVGLVNTLRHGSGGIRELMADAERLGITFNRIESAKIEAANDAITRMQAALRGVGNSLAVSFAPSIEKAADALTGFLTGGMVSSVLDTVPKVLTAIGNSGYYAAIAINSVQQEIVRLEATILRLIDSDLAKGLISLTGKSMEKLGDLVEGVAPGAAGGLRGLGMVASNPVFGDLISIGVDESLAENEARLRTLVEDSGHLYEAMEQANNRKYELLTGANLNLAEDFEGSTSKVDELSNSMSSALSLLDRLEAGRKSPFEKWQEDSMALQKVFEAGLIDFERYADAQFQLASNLHSNDPYGNLLADPGEFRAVQLENIALNSSVTQIADDRAVRAEQVDRTNGLLDRLVDLTREGSVARLG